MDRISKLPLGIIETILCLLPIQEAVRTSILSKEWRYHWATIPKLVFIDDKYRVSTDRVKIMAERRKFLFAIYQALLVHKGPIHEFTISMVVDSSCVEIGKIIRHLSKKNSVKILKLDLDGKYKLPLSLFSLHQLTDLYLNGCILYHQPSFNTFNRLTTLNVEFNWSCAKRLLHLLSSCPSLKRLTLNSLIEPTDVSEDPTIVDLFECLPVIEYLSLWFYIILHFSPTKLPKMLPTTLIHLKYLCVECVSINHKYGFPFLFLLIRSSPNLEKLKLDVFGIDRHDEDEIASFTLKDYSDIIMLEHLKELEILDFNNVEIELDFVKLIMAKSPVLKKVKIFLIDKPDEDEESRISKILIGSPCASPVVKVIVR